MQLADPGVGDGEQRQRFFGGTGTALPASTVAWAKALRRRAVSPESLALSKLVSMALEHQPRRVESVRFEDEVDGVLVLMQRSGSVNRGEMHVALAYKV